MKATRKTIPILIEQRQPFRNGSGTLRAELVTRPGMADIIRDADSLNDEELSRLRIDAGPDYGGIVYVIVSYDTPIAWETRRGHVYKVDPDTLTQTSRQHAGLLYSFHGRLAGD